MSDSDLPKPEGRWYQFSLRTALALMVPFALWCGMLSNYWYFGPRILFFGYPVGVAGIILYFRTAIRSERRTLGLKAIGACAMIAIALCMFWIAWPLRSLSVDLYVLSTHLLLLVRPTPGSGDVEGVATLTMFAVHLVVLMCGFQVILLAKRIPGVQRHWLGTWSLCVSFMLALFLLCVAYPKVRGLRHDRWLTAEPSRVVILFSSSSGCGSAPPPFAVATNRDDVALCTPEWMREGDTLRVIVISTEEMREILFLLREEDFFEMDCCLHPFGTIDGLWETLQVNNGKHEHQVSSYAGTPDGEPFDRLMSRLKKKVGIEE